VCGYLATYFGVKSRDDSDNKNTEETDDAQPTLAASAAEPEEAEQVTGGTKRLLVNIRDLLETSVSMMARVGREKDENERMMNDWMVAAAVIDRISFILIAIFFVAGNVALIAVSFVPHDT